MIRPAPPAPPRRRRRADEGTLEVFVADEQSDEPVDLGRWEALARAALHAEGVSGAAELAVLFVDEASMAELNERFLGARGPTDVLAFPIDARDEEDVIVGRSPDGSTPGPDRQPGGDAPLLLGDVVICPAVAARNAPDHAGTYADELALLLVHGILHVLGMDHASDAEAKDMQARERDLLTRFHRTAS